MLASTRKVSAAAIHNRQVLYYNKENCFLKSGVLELVR